MLDLETTVRRVLKHAPAIPELPETAGDRHLTAAAERIVRAAAAWQADSGRIIDPYVHAETNTVTARYLGALGLLLRRGRCLDLIPSATAALTPALEDLFERRTEWGEFIVKEALMAYEVLRGRVPADLCRYWTHLLADYDPEETYGRTFSRTPDDLQNYCTFAIAGEALKARLGLADNQAFIDRYVEQQLTLFDDHGMYYDPHGPMVYDLTPRMNLSIALWAGCRGRHHDRLDEMLRRGALAQLLYQSVNGEVPYGGRSNQQNFIEATFMVVCEFEARRWAGLGDAAIAGAFRRASRRAAAAIADYLADTPVFFTKNRFPPETQHGRQKGYGFYGAYSLLIASQLGFAQLLADDTIPEGPCPAECGGYAWTTGERFHKAFAACQGTHVEIDTRADLTYDATGWGRLHFHDCPAELALSAPIPASPPYLTAVPPASAPAAIGPGWDGLWLAGLSADDGLKATCRILEQTPDRVALTVDYRSPAGGVSELLSLGRDQVDLEVVQTDGRPLAYRVPLLRSNGRNEAVITRTANGFAVCFMGYTYSVACTAPGIRVSLLETEVPNRNGIYRLGVITADASRLTLRFALQRP